MFDHTVDHPDDLKSCPFCGQKPPHLALRRTDDLTKANPSLFRIDCLGCLAKGPYTGATTIIEAKRPWNERVMSKED